MRLECCMWKPYESPQMRILGSVGAMTPAAPGITFAKPGIFFDFPGSAQGNTNKPPPGTPGTS
jgi:hypothetical protein